MTRSAPLRPPSFPSLPARGETPATSEPASGSVKHRAPRSGSGPQNRGRNFCFCAGVPMWMIGRYARPAPMRPVAIPAQPQFSSSFTMQWVSVERMPPPPYSDGKKAVSSPRSCAFFTTCHGIAPFLSYSRETGRISRSANSCAVFWMRSCSSVRWKSTIDWLLRCRLRAIKSSPLQLGPDLFRDRGQAAYRRLDPHDLRQASAELHLPRDYRGLEIGLTRGDLAPHLVRGLELEVRGVLRGHGPGGDPPTRDVQHEREAPVRDRQRDLRRQRRRLLAPLRIQVEPPRELVEEIPREVVHEPEDFLPRDKTLVSTGASGGGTFRSAGPRRTRIVQHEDTIRRRLSGVAPGESPNL